MLKLNKPALDLLRAKHCLTMADLAKKAGISKTTIATGYKKDIDPVPIGKLAKALCVAPEDIIAKEE